MKKRQLLFIGAQLAVMTGGGVAEFQKRTMFHGDGALHRLRLVSKARIRA